MSSNSFKNKVTDKLFAYKSHMYIYISLLKIHKGWHDIKPNNEWFFTKIIKLFGTSA